MNNKKIWFFLLILIISIIIVVGIGMYVLNNEDEINQGSFRMNDFVLESGLLVAEKDVEKIENLSSLVFDITQTNKITMLIASDSDAKSIYIDNIYITNPMKTGKLYITQSNYEEKYNLENLGSGINIYPAKKDGQYKIEINVINEKCMEDVNVTSESQSVRYDGTMLSLLNTKVSDLRFDLSFNLNIVDESGKISTSKIELTMPSEDLITSGISVVRKDVSNFLFTIK